MVKDVKEVFFEVTEKIVLGDKTKYTIRPGTYKMDGRMLGIMLDLEQAAGRKCIKRIEK